MEKQGSIVQRLRGRPSRYTQEFIDKIYADSCDASHTWVSIGLTHGISPQTARRIAEREQGRRQEIIAREAGEC